MDELAEFKTRYENRTFKVEQPILDIGGGDGTFLRSQGISKATIIEGGIYNGENYKYIHADITKKFPKLDKKFKTIFMMEVLEHINNPLYLLAQAYDLLEDDGVLYMAIPYTEIGEHHHHVGRWKINEIQDQLKKLGFGSKVIQKRRRFKGLGFFLPHCWLVLRAKKRKFNSNERNIKNYNLKI